MLGGSPDVLSLERADRGEPEAEWVGIFFPRPVGSCLNDRGNMSASEQMFSLGAPAAHIVAYEDRLRENRTSRTLQRMRGR